MGKILVVDDEQDILRVVRTVLEIEGHQVEIQQDARQALAQIEAGDYDLVVVDLLMPVLTGEDIVKRLKTTKPDLKVLVLTGTADLFDLDAIHAQGIYCMLEKPFDPVRLLEIVRDAIPVRSDAPS